MIRAILICINFVTNIDAVSASTVAAARAAAAELDRLLAVKIPSTPDQQVALQRSIDTALATIEKSGDAGLLLKYQNLSNAKKEAIKTAELLKAAEQEKKDLKEDILVLEQIAGEQEVKLEKTKQKVATLITKQGGVTGQIKKDIVSLFENIDVIVADYLKDPDNIRFMECYQKLNNLFATVPYSSSKKLEMAAEEAKIKAFGILFAASFEKIIDQCDTAFLQCADQYEDLSLFLGSILDEPLSIIEYDYDVLYTLLSQLTVQWDVVIDGWNKNVIQDGFGAITLSNLTVEEQDRLQESLQVLVEAYQKIVQLILEVIAVVNQTIDVLIEDKDLDTAQMIWSDCVAESKIWYDFIEKLDIFESLLVKLPEDYSRLIDPAIKSSDLLLVWDALAQKKIKVVGDQAEQKEVLSLQDEIKKVAEEKKKKNKGVELPIVIPPSQAIKNEPAFLTELKKKTKEKKSTADDVTIESGLLLAQRLAKLKKVEEELKQFTFFDKVDTSVVELEKAFEKLYQKSDRVAYLPKPTSVCGQYYAALKYIDDQLVKVGKKTIKPSQKDKEFFKPVVFTDEDEKKFELAKNSLLATLKTVRERCQTFGYGVATATIKKVLEKDLLSTIGTISQTLLKKVKAGEAIHDQQNRFAKEAARLYFMIRWGVYQDKGILLGFDTKMPAELEKSCSDLIPQFTRLVDQIIAFYEGYPKKDDELLNLVPWFGNSIVGSLTTVVVVIKAIKPTKEIEALINRWNVFAKELVGEAIIFPLDWSNDLASLLSRDVTIMSKAK